MKRLDQLTLETISIILRGKNRLSLPILNITINGFKSFKYHAVKQCNTLPGKVRDKAGTKEFILLLRNFDIYKRIFRFVFSFMYFHGKPAN